MIGIEQRGLEKARDNLKRAERDVDEAASRWVRTLSLEASRRLKLHLTGAPGFHQVWGRTSPDGPFLSVRTGTTRRRITPGGTVLSRQGTQGREYVAEVGSPDRHLRFLEEGGVIRGRQFLRIPTRHAQTGAGVDRYTGRSIRTIEDAFLFRSKRGLLWAAQRRGPQLRLLYLLVRQARYRGRHIFDAVRKELEKLARKLAGVEVERVVRRANT